MSSLELSDLKVLQTDSQLEFKKINLWTKVQSVEQGSQHKIILCTYQNKVIKLIF